MCRQVLPWPEERGTSARALAPSAQLLSVCAAAVSRKETKVMASLNTPNESTYTVSVCYRSHIESTTISNKSDLVFYFIFPA